MYYSLCLKTIDPTSDSFIKPHFPEADDLIRSRGDLLETLPKTLDRLFFYCIGPIGRPSPLAIRVGRVVHLYINDHPKKLPFYLPFFFDSISEELKKSNSRINLRHVEESELAITFLEAFAINQFEESIRRGAAYPILGAFNKERGREALAFVIQESIKLKFQTTIKINHTDEKIEWNNSSTHLQNLFKNREIVSLFKELISDLNTSICVIEGGLEPKGFKFLEDSLFLFIDPTQQTLFEQLFSLLEIKQKLCHEKKEKTIEYVRKLINLRGDRDGSFYQEGLTKLNELEGKPKFSYGRFTISLEEVPKISPPSLSIFNALKKIHRPIVNKVCKEFSYLVLSFEPSSDSKDHLLRWKRGTSMLEASFSLEEKELPYVLIKLFYSIVHSGAEKEGAFKTTNLWQDQGLKRRFEKKLKYEYVLNLLEAEINPRLSYQQKKELTLVK